MELLISPGKLVTLVVRNQLLVLWVIYLLKREQLQYLMVEKLKILVSLYVFIVNRVPVAGS
jgi:hypothetical protein